MAAGQHNFALDRGVTERRTYTWKNKLTGVPVDLTGASAALTLRDARAPNAAVFATLSTANSYITLGGVAGTIDVNFYSGLLQGRREEVVAFELRATLANGDVRSLLKGTIEVRDDDQVTP